MTEATRWQKSSYSGGGDGNTCVEIARVDTDVAIRDSKRPSHATLTVTAGVFTTFVEELKAYYTVTDFAEFRH
ncbi:DUF397 domain-containing protein [Streptomyces sp. 15-116A]|uniref:DUF397 domain-containing protein n=1 Tax=Streptomyces sp. 15-116A TaxID=2259035 RepID=UPI0021B256E5|nr:DUF397 domain-containing protein [Streptomyces sp. 15-116A]MCT7352196.1 DUF397 domain-containing protein [Streptomyces sp. 15-116A]